MDEPEVPIKPTEPAPIVKQNGANKGLTVSPGTATIIAAVVGLIGIGVGAVLQGWSNTKLERQKLESQLILKALEPWDIEIAKKKLLFLLRAEFIQIEIPKLAALVSPPGEVVSVDKFDNPMLGDYRLDYCYAFNGQCGLPAASAWCKKQNYKDAFTFVQDFDVSSRGIKTKVISTEAICTAPPGRCDSFKSISCQYR
jgi:hypothetical protein